MSISRQAVSVTALTYLIVLTCQTTVLPDTLGAKTAARILNALTLLVFGLGAAWVFFQGRTRGASAVMTVSCALVALGLVINLARSVGPETLGYVGALLPWLAALSIPFFRRYDLRFAWRMYYAFMLVAAIGALCEYSAVFAGALTPTVIETERGMFLKGIVTIFHQLEDGRTYDRMYGVFAEPGTFAMLLLPAVAYALVRRRWFGIAVFLTCLALTRSLGGVASLALMGGLYVYQRIRVRWVRGLVVLVMLGAAGLAFGGFAAAYEAKQASATVREENARLFVQLAWPMIRANPFGLPLTGSSLTGIASTDAVYLGSNFSPYTMFVQGGVLSLLGYLGVLTAVCRACLRYYSQTSAWRGDRRGLSPAFLSLPPLLLFVVQRQAIFEMALFAYLFAAPVMRVLHQTRVKVIRPSAPVSMTDLWPGASESGTV